MIRVGKLIYRMRFFIAAVIFLAAGAVIFWPDNSVSTAASGVKKAVLSQPSAGIDALLKEAQNFQADGRLSEAVGAYEKVLGLAPGFAPVYLKLGQLYFRMDMPLKAEEAYLQAIDKGLNDPDVFLYLGYIRETRGDLEQAMAYYDKAEFAGSRDPVLYFNKGNVHARQGHKDKALEYFKRAVILNPKYMDAFVNLAIILAEEGEYADAQFYLEKAEKLGYDAPVEFKSGLAKELKK